MPVLFVGHGSPMNVVEDNRWSRGFKALGAQIPRPQAILSVSAHWFVDATLVTSDGRPDTIHDFTGFPAELYAIRYPAPGAADVARRTCERLGLQASALSTDWGLDHGTWSVLRWMYPDADVPVAQLSIDRRLAPRQHHDLARPLAALRDEGVLILGSGNVVHNLADAFRRRRRGDTETPDWAIRFDGAARDALIAHDAEALLSLWPDSEDGKMAHPTADHWLPLVYAFAATDERDAVRFPIEGFDWGSLSMRSVLFG